MNRKLLNVLLYAGLTLALLLPRLPALDAFATGDEPYWLSMGANFYYALGQREFENTVYEYQPAVTTMWVVTAAMLIYFPEYRGLGQGYLEFEKGVLDPFLLEHGKDPLVLLRDARLIQVTLVVALLMAAFYLLQRLIDYKLAAFLILLAGLDPFYLGHSRLLNHEAMLTAFVLVSILSLTLYLRQGRTFIFLLLSAVTAALAQLTKSSAIAALAPVGFLFLLDIIQRRAVWKQASLDAVKSLGLWLVVLGLAYILFWPGMWVAPGKMLYQVYGNAFSYAFQGARLIALDNAEATPLKLDANLGGLIQLAGVLLWRTTPLTWIGLLLGILLPLTRAWRLVPPATKHVSALAVVTGLAFIVMFAVAQGRNSPHYTLASYFMFNIFAGIGWATALRWLVPQTSRAWIQASVLALVLVSQAGSAVSQYPYYFTYENPLVPKGEKPQFAYGEGLELAAQYLSSQPDSKEAVALVYYSRGCFSYFYHGPVERFKPYYAEPGYQPELKNALDRADYLVLYPAIQNGLPKYDTLFSALSVVEPEKVIWLNGFEYAVIYRVASFPLSVFKTLYP